MANPRNTIAFEGIAGVYVTMLVDGSSLSYDATKPNGSVHVGKAVKLTGDSAVGLTTDGSNVFGKLVLIEADGKATVQVDGFCGLPGGNGAAFTYGGGIVGAVDANSVGGAIRMVSSAVAAEMAVARGRVISAGDTSNVVVQL